MFDEKGTVVEITVTEPACEHCGRKERDTEYVSFRPDIADVFRMVCDFDNLEDLSNTVAVDRFSYWIQELLSNPMKYAPDSHNSRIHDWSSYGVVVDGLARMRTVAEEYPKGNTKFRVREF